MYLAWTMYGYENHIHHIFYLKKLISDLKSTTSKTPVYQML